jgi:hypothetical protein
VQCTHIIPTVHDVYFLRHDKRNDGGFHGWFFSLWKNLWPLSREPRQSFTEMPREGSSIVDDSYLSYLKVN